MNVKELIRDPGSISRALKKMGQEYVATQDLKIVFPVKYENDDLCEIGARFLVVGIFAIIAGGTYATLTVNSMISLTPDEVTTEEIEGEQHYVLSFDKGSTVIDNIELVREDLLTYSIYHHFLAKSNEPWFWSYDDVCNIFNTAKSHADANIAPRPETIHLLVSVIARDKDNPKKYFRQAVKSVRSTAEQPMFIGIGNVELGAQTTTAKLGGAYFETGVTSALVDPSDIDSNVDKALRA